MKAIRTVKAVKSNVQSQESTEFSIGDMGKIIEILRSRMYSNPIQTMVQEYLANARDACRETGNKLIEVTLNDTSFSVRDSGPGISADRMKLFCQYGATTKDQTNNQNGGFGLGSKLAWAYTDKFFINTFIDGTLTKYMAHIGANKNGTLERLSSEPTSERNGTEIRVPIESDDYTSVTNAVMRAVQFWRADEQPLVNCVTLDFEKIVLYPNIELYQSSEFAKSVVVAIDGIPYQLNDEMTDLDFNLASNATLVLHVNNGVIEVSANRESITQDESTKQALQGLCSQAGKSVANWIKLAFRKATDVTEAIDQFKMVNQYISTQEHEHNGYLIERNWNNTTIFSKDFKTLSIKAVTSHYRRNKTTRALKIGTPIVVVDEQLSAAKLNEKIKQLVADPQECQILSGDDFALLSKIAADLALEVTSSVTLEKKKRSDREELESGEVRAEVFTTGHRTSLETKVLDIASGQYLYLTERTLKPTEYESLVDYANDKGLTVCVLKPRAAKQVESLSNWRTIDQVLAKIPAKLVKAASYAIADRALAPAFASIEDFSRILDPKLCETLKTLSAHSEIRLSSSDFLCSYICEREPELKALKESARNLPAYLDTNYPLLKYISTYRIEYVNGGEKTVHMEPKLHAESIIDYVNGAYSAKGI